MGQCILLDGSIVQPAREKRVPVSCKKEVLNMKILGPWNGAKYQRSYLILTLSVWSPISLIMETKIFTVHTILFTNICLPSQSK